MHIGKALQDNKSLVTLNMSFNKITDEGMAHLAKVYNCEFLRA